MQTFNDEPKNKEIQSIAVTQEVSTKSSKSAFLSSIQIFTIQLL